MITSNRTWTDAILELLEGIRGGGGQAFSPTVAMKQNATVAQAVEERFRKTPVGEIFEGKRGFKLHKQVFKSGRFECI